MYKPFAKRVGNAVRLAEVVQVLVRYGFSDVVHRLGLHEGLPAKVLRGLRLIEEPSAEMENQGRRLRAALTELGPNRGQVRANPEHPPRTDRPDMANDLGLLQDLFARLVSIRSNP